MDQVSQDEQVTAGRHKGSITKEGSEETTFQENEQGVQLRSTREKGSLLGQLRGYCHNPDTSNGHVDQ